MGLHCKAHEAPDGRIEQLSAEPMSTQLVYGNGGDLIVATRPPGYHSRPHRHASEQLNYVSSGELWVFVDGEGFHLRSGDFLRVPRDAVHWSWNRGSGPCVLVEFHTPSMHDDPLWSHLAVGLFAAGEQPAVRSTAQNEFLSDEEANVAAVEARYFRHP